MTDPTCCAARCSSPAAYCGNCDLQVGLEGLHVLSVVRRGISSREGRVPVGADGLPGRGVVAASYRRREVELIDAPCFGRPVRVVGVKRTWACTEPSCRVGVFTEQNAQVAQPRAACWRCGRTGGRCGPCVGRRVGVGSGTALTAQHEIKYRPAQVPEGHLSPPCVVRDLGISQPDLGWSSHTFREWTRRGRTANSLSSRADGAQLKVPRPAH